MNKTELIHIRIDPQTKQQSEAVLSKLGINTSYAVSLFLNQVIMHNGLPFSVQIPENETEAEVFASAMEATGGNGEVSEKNKKIIHLYSKGEIDYETASFAIERNFING